MKIIKYAETVTRQDLAFFWTIAILLFCQIQLSKSKTDILKGSTNFATAQLYHHHGKTQRVQYRFGHSVYNVTIPENSVGKTYAKAILHEDFAGITIGPGVDVKYRIVAGDRDKLFKAEERLVGNFAFLAIRTRTSNVVLNREKNEEYILKVRALINYSHGKNVSSYETDTTVHVKVLDRNDLSPLFYPTEYFVTIPEDIAKHRSILKVTADDADLGINGEIYYSFLIDNDYFAIHPTSGDISVIRQLKYSDNSHFELVVLANDRGSAISHNSHQASKAKVSITVTQVNLYAPEIYVKTFSSINENSAPFICGIVKVNDKDIGLNGKIKKVEIVNGNPDGNFRITTAENENEFYIELNKFAKLNKKKFIYNLTLRAEDRAVIPRFSYKTVPIQIIPESKNIPIFTKLIYEVSIPETVPPNMPVIRLKVTDPDMGENALVYLEIVGGNEGGEFRINPDSGLLYTQKPLDAERKSLYTLTVSAIDQANVGARKQSSAKVKIHIQDMNDNDPIFDGINKIIDLKENELAGTFVVKLSAKDRDSGENAYISYSIANLNEVPFEIDHFTGIIKTTKLINYETMRRNYAIIVRASDWGLPYRRQTELELIINIKDINDNRPQFERVNCNGKVLRNAPTGTEMFTLSAIDFDAGDYITYRLISGNEDGCFNIDPTTGVLSIGCDLTDVVLDEREIKVSATDGIHFSDEMSIKIKLVHEDSNEPIDLVNGYGSFECRETGVARRLAEILAAAEKNNAKNVEESVINDLALTPSRYGENVHNPEFVNFPQELSVNESIQLGESIAWISARDRDLGYNGKLVYAISDGDYDSVFRIDPDNGELQIIGYLDRERQNEYILNITVYDLGQPQKSNSKMLPITILDSNDNPPILQKSLASFRMTESALNGTVVFCLNASDADEGQNAEITYSLLSDTNMFYINETTGCIILNNTLDREKEDFYELHAVAKDNGIPMLMAEGVINIIVDDINDNAPVFGVQEYIFKVREDIPRGTVIATIEAIDFDTGPNGEILFSLKEETQDKGLFKIDKHTGTIRTQGYLDYENRQVHNLIVSAIDCGVPSLTSDMSVVIEVIDVNENRYAPEFDNFVYSGKVKENQPKGTIVLNITANDLDGPGPDSKISYFITGGDGLGVFAVNDQGSIRTLSHLDAESKTFYWITLCAQDNAIVPLCNCVQVYIEVENENDNVPLTDKPVYYVSVMEGISEERNVIKLNATDDDNDPNQIISYKIISGNPEGYFEISTTGVLKTTERKLDRENQGEHILEIAVSDNGSPSLSSVTRVVVSVTDINDHGPEFDQRFYKIQVPSTAKINESIFQVHATDSDIGENGRISYSIKSGKGKNKFRIDNATGYIYLLKPLEPDTEYEINIKAEDNGNPKRSQTCRLSVLVIPVLKNSSSPPVISKKSINNIVDVTESDRPGFLVALIQATDEDNDQLWYNISSGDEGCSFYIGRENGNLLLAKYLDWETQPLYNLTITVTDGIHVVKTSLIVHVVDTNDNRPQFTKDVYHVNISESIEEESIIMQLHATDKDEDKKIFYHMHAARDPSSLTLFRIDSLSGNVIVTQRLDYERIAEHVLIVFAKDQGTPAKRNYAKIIITVHDHNDHSPEFMAKIIQSKIPESATIGSKLVHVFAVDRDSGKNAEIRYSIITGNVGNIFEIDSILGVISLSSNLNINKMQEYMLQVRATDLGEPPLSSQLPVHIVVTMSENDPPRFFTPSITVEIYENLPMGSFVAQLEARSSSSIFYEIIDGNLNDVFRVNPSTGVIVINSNIDYETNKLFNITVCGTNMASASANQNVVIHILDKNDNAPYFLEKQYVGFISEAAAIGSFVKNFELKNSRLLLNASDSDVGVNGMLQYHINNDLAREFFQIDSSSGSIKLHHRIDYEQIKKISFSVTLSDMGKPKLYSNVSADITVFVENVNDCPPVFESKELNCTIYTPTFDNVFVIKLVATDADIDEQTKIRYDIVDGNENGCFQIDQVTGIITTKNVDRLKDSHTLHIRASDGLYSAITQVYINIENVEDANFIFQRPMYEFNTIENSTKITTIGLVNVVGSLLHENVMYDILNPTDMFQIGASSGAIKTTGVMFDRELQDTYKLYIEAKSVLYNGSSRYIRRATAAVHVTISDINDNCPMFVNLPYFATVSVDDLKDTIITQIKAIDLDSAENGEVRYEMKKGNGELFKIDRKTGDLSLKQSIEGHNRQYELIIAAYDGAITPCSTEISVQIKVIDRSMPIFDKQFYSNNIKEDVEIYSALSITIKAESPLNRKLIYTISQGNNDENFEIDYRTGALYVVDELDYELQKSHELLIRATDSISGIYAEVVLSINVLDANDCYPEIEHDNYNVTLPENIAIGSQILKINASDMDSGVNGELSYLIESIDGKNDTDIFYIDIAEGYLYLKKSLDYEQSKSHHIVVKVNDHGTPSLTSKTNVHISVEDLNDNSPRFIEPSFSSKLSMAAVRGQFVAIAKAYDPDLTDNERLIYKIVDGNELQTYSIDEKKAVIRLQNMQNFTDKINSFLNVSVSDGIHTTYARVKISIFPENNYSPIFENAIYKKSIQENKPIGTQIITVRATDNDTGLYGNLIYEIVSEEMKKNFEINRITGLITTRVIFDRESKDLFEVIIKAIDAGGKFAYCLVKIFVTDFNDNSPYFKVKEYKAVVNEINLNKTILKIKAFDNDVNENALIKYGFEPNSIDKKLQDVIAINELNGQITFKNTDFENNSFQFFVRATDSGNPPLHNDIPVSIEVVNSGITIPYFEKTVINLQIVESTPPGTVLTRLHVSGNFSLKYSVITESANFFVTENGDLVLMQTLDREQEDEHYFVVCVETSTMPILYAYSEVFIHVQDENDNYPKFENTIYSVEIPENIQKVSSVVKITATDEDTGSNGDIRYYLDDEPKSVIDIFDIDIYTGWITLLTTIDREQQSEFNFNVIATDNGQPKHISKVPVSIKIIDCNDNAPQFKLPIEKIEVLESALPGTVLTHFLLIDSDIEKNDIDYYIVSGDDYSQFQIGKSGELFVAKFLDRETIPTYNLSLLATDGKYTAETNALIELLDVNDNIPFCLKPRYKLEINESLPLGSPIVKINAIDIDENKNYKIRFYLSGKGSDDFVIGKENGIVKVAKHIDRENQSKYRIYAHAQDGQELLRECTSEILINVNDLNDNAPEFSMTQYMVSIAEDAQLQTVITKIHATDKDFGKNRKIVYSIDSKSKEYFSISKSTGIIKLEKNLDRETIPIFNISIKAEDQGIPKLHSLATLIVNVLDINDNPPDFTMQQYLAHVPENASIGTEVIRVLATSKDIGINAEVQYYILGGNEQKKFTINSDSGVISVNDELDFEKTKSYLLTVQAIDGGTPPLSSIAYVNISILDVNDNKPMFEQNAYRISIKEDILAGEKVVKVLATDEDSPKNGYIKYNIDRGDRLSQFTINSDDGTIYVDRPLDRETISSYMLEIRACDNGLPVLCNYVHVKVDVLDTNDNAPIFSNTNYSIVLQENKPLGFAILKFDVFDADDEPNATPFTFDLRSGNEGGLFRLQQDGTLSTAGRFNHKVCNQFILQIRVFDNGTPPLFSDTWVTIKIIEESQYPPVIMPLEITVNSFEDEFSGAFIGQIYATDQDKYDELMYSLTPTNSETYQTTKLFNISQNTGKIYAFNNLDVGLYKINVSVTDGKFTVTTIVKVNVELVTSDMVKYATVIKFGRVSPSDFLLSHRKGFIRAIRKIMRCGQKDIIIITLQDEDISKKAVQHNSTEGNFNRLTRSIDSDLHVVFVVRKQQIMPTAEAYFSNEEVRQAVISNINEIEVATNLVVEEVMSTMCESQQNACVYGVCKTLITLLKSNISTIYTDVISFAAPKFKRISKCFCKPGFDGKTCNEPVNACFSDPCPPQRVCLPSDSPIGYQCICPKGFSGQFCEIKSSKCHNESCESNSFTAVSFSGKSYAHYKINKEMAKNTIENQFSCSLHIRTVQQTGTLLYASGKVDYNVLEIVNGAVQYRFELGSGEGVISVSSVYISDGEWHSIGLERLLNSAKLIVDNKHISQGSAPGVNGILNIQSNDVFVGAEVRPHPSIIGYEDIQRGFIGCMANIKIALEPLPLYISGGSTIAALKRFTNVEFRCDPLNVLVYLGVCGAQPCFNGGICTDLGNDKFKCLCHTRFSGDLCELDLDPCASAPCLFGGRCEYEAPNNYTCVCPMHLSGKRCEYGKFCSPNPCKNGGLCEEGDGVSHCMCRGYTGPTCEIDVNECENQPCGNGATCINEAGSFRCICPSYLTGASCGDPLYSNSITTKLKNFSLEHISGIISGIVIVFVVIVAVLCCMMFKKSTPRNNRNRIAKEKNKNSFKEANLNSLIDKDKYNKHNAKISNLEVNQRPISYTPTTNDSMFPTNTTFVNNLDILRSYGSAGDELENIPFEYQKINRTNQHVNINPCNLNETEAGGAYKQDWSDQMHLKTFTENKFNNDVKRDSSSFAMNRLSGGKLIQVAMPNVCHSSTSNGVEYSGLGHGQYHWDCSDWVRKSHNPLPDITEVPCAEIADSSSFHSNDSNESKLRNTCLVHREVDPTRDMTALNEDISSIDCELESCIQPLTLQNSHNDSYSRLSSFNNSETEDYKINTGKVYLRHPDTYLPPINTPSETEGESSTNEPFSKPKSEIVNRRTISENSEEVYIFPSTAEGIGSNSNISVRLCEIEDSELEEFLPHT